jgi:Flp pilus assembly protein TadG
MRHTQHRKQCGQSMVEAALVLSLFMMVILGLVNFGYILWMHQTLEHRARTAARYGVINPTDTTGMQNMVLYNSTTGSGPAMFGLTASNVSAVHSSSNSFEDRINVTVSGYQFFLWFPGMSIQGKDITVSLPVETY